MKKRKLRDIEVSAIGLGCMGFNHNMSPFTKHYFHWNLSSFKGNAVGCQKQCGKFTNKKT